MIVDYSPGDGPRLIEAEFVERFMVRLGAAPELL
ncbi:hypothetical protein ABID25_006193 [Mesorhizobium abyssinicae]